jgi:predicted 2-oxoglutarate/Fe(II)-dependent dioxygenase YbiX
MQRRDINPGAFVIDDVLNAEECAALIRRAEDQGFELAPITTAKGFKVDLETRNNDRVIFDDVHLATLLWSRVRHAVPQILAVRQAVGLNERFRLYRYAPGQRFSWHSDGVFRRASGEMSLLTFMIYLNDGYSGGETRFEDTKVVGRAGMALLFHHGMVHEGAEVTEGRKYALRSDVMYGPIGTLGG